MNEEEILNLLKHGTNEEIGRAVLILSRLKDPNYKEILSKIMHSGDFHLSTLAAYALGEAGEKSGLEFLLNLFHNAEDIIASAPNSEKNLINFKMLDDILKLPDNVNRAFKLYNSSYFIESKENLKRLLEIYSLEPPKTNIPYYDNFIAFSVSKTRGILLDAIAICEFNLGNVTQAFEYSLQAMAIAQDINDPQLLKTVYADLGHVHMSLGNYYSALELLHKSLEIDESSYDPWRKKNRLFTNLSQLYLAVGQYEKAMEYIENALKLSEQEHDMNGKARCLNAKGAILYNTDNVPEAEGLLLEALNLSIHELHDQHFQVLVLGNLAFLYYSLADIQKAEKYLEEAHGLSVSIGDKAEEKNILTTMAMVAIEKGDASKAMGYAQSALVISTDIYDIEGQAVANFIIGIIEHYSYGDFDNAYTHYKEALSLSETLRKGLVLDEFKISFAGNYTSMYQQMVVLCIEMGAMDDAFEYIERSKSRALVDVLSPAMDNINSQVTSGEIMQEINVLKRKLDFLRDQLRSRHLSLNEQTVDKRKEGVDESIKVELSGLEKEYKKTFEDLKMKDPDHASLLSVDVITLKEFQETLHKDTLCLEFCYTGTEVIIIAIKKDEPPLPVRIPFDETVDVEKFYNLLAALSNVSSTDTRSHEYIRDVKQPLAYFYELLIQPIADILPGIKHIIVIPHYFLHYLPFHALYDSANKQYLIDKLSVSYAPSSTALYFSHKKDRRKYVNALILANPSNDLLYAEEEGKDIKSVFKEQGHLFTKEQASFDNLMSFQEADVIHLACHGYFRADEPIFSSIVLSGSDNKEQPFFLPDIFNLKLKASLVTLSACETGQIQFTTGDELIGMSRAFFYAGAPALLTSLWTVNDKSTALLMDRFYERLVCKKETKSDALKDAIQELKSTPEYNHPYFWAPFFLSGDWQ